MSLQNTTWYFLTKFQILTLRLILFPLCIIWQIKQYPGAMSSLTCVEIAYLRQTENALTSNLLSNSPGATIIKMYPACQPVLEYLELPLNTVQWFHASNSFTEHMVPSANITQLSHVSWKSVLKDGYGGIRAPVHAHMHYPEEEAAFFRLIFGGCGLIALLFHVPTIECWIKRTRNDDMRLKKLGEHKRKLVSLSKNE